MRWCINKVEGKVLPAKVVASAIKITINLVDIPALNNLNLVDVALSMRVPHL